MRLNRLRELREDRKLSQQALAEMVNTSQQNIYKYENGITEPDIQMLKTLADVFHTSIDYLVEYTPEEYQAQVAQLSEDIAYEIDMTTPQTGARVSGETLHLVASYSKCSEPVKEHLLYIIDELSHKDILCAETEA